MTKKAITSKSNITVQAELVENGRYIVRNAELIKAATNAGFRAEYKKICMSQHHAVVECTMKDKMGRTMAVNVGEVIPQYLRGEISQAYPYTLAFTRAFDHAALNCLQFDVRKVFCDKRDIPEEVFVGSIPCGLDGMQQLPVLVAEDDKYVIPHTCLEAIIADHPGRFSYSYEAFATGLEINVVCCTLEDTVTGRVVTAVGETSGVTLQTDIARNYPTTMAFNRAFDKAVIHMLNIPVDRRVFSDSECLMGKKDRKEKPEQRAGQEPAAQSVIPVQEANVNTNGVTVNAVPGREDDLFVRIEKFEALL